MTTTVRALPEPDGSTFDIEVTYTGEHVQLHFTERWESLREFAGELLELIKQAEANSDPS